MAKRIVEDSRSKTIQHSTGQRDLATNMALCNGRAHLDLWKWILSPSPRSRNVRHTIQENDQPHECVANADETKLLMGKLSDYTISKKGTKDVAIRDNGQWKDQITAHLACTAVDRSSPLLHHPWKVSTNCCFFMGESLRMQTKQSMLEWYCAVYRKWMKGKSPPNWWSCQPLQWGEVGSCRAGWILYQH